MPTSKLDLMVEFAVGELASGDNARVRKLVRTLAARWPSERALMISFALTSAASVLEDVLKGPATARSAGQAYRLSALVAADILAIEVLRDAPARAQDLLHYWRRVDPYFLEL